MIRGILLQLFSTLVYPGLLTALLLSVLVGRLLGGPASGGRALGGLPAALAGRRSFPLAASALLVLAALILLPWPRPGALPPPAPADLLLLWALIEGSSILLVVPFFSSSSPAASRVATREAQLNLSGRIVIWIAAWVALSAGVSATYPAALLLATLAVLLALPAAAGRPPFSYENSGAAPVMPLGAGTLTDEDAALLQWGRRLLSVFWLALLATIFVPLPGLAWWADAAMRIAILVALASAARGLRGLQVSRTLPAALRWCWWVALPCALLAVALAR